MRKISSLHRLAVSLALMFGLLGSGWITLRAAAAPPSDRLTAIVNSASPGQFVVGVVPHFDEDDLRAMLASSGATLEDWLPNLGLALVSMSLGRERAVAGALDIESAVDFIAPNRQLASVADVPNDPYWGQQWGMAKVAAPAAWNLGWSDSSVVIAIIDTGVSQQHWDLRDHTWYNPGESAADPNTGAPTCDAPIAHNGVDDDANGYVDDCRGWDFVSDDPDPGDEHGHGTFVAGIASAVTNNPNLLAPGSYEGVAGMGRQASLMALRVLDRGGIGYAFDIAAAIDYATAQHVQVVNLSLTFSPATPDSPDIEILRRAAAAAQAAGVLVIGASGNQNYNGVSYPAKLPGVLAVGASTRQDTRAYFSNYGARLDLVAPGEGIVSTLWTPELNSYGYYGSSGSGTSFAAPHAAGTAALVRGLRPDLSQDVVYELIRRSADDVGTAGFDPYTGWGRLNADRAVSEAAIGLRLALVADRPTVAVGGQTPVHVQLTGPSGTAAGLGARVNFTASLGATAPISVTADGQGLAVLSFTAGPATGVAHVAASLGGITATLPITVTSGVPARIDLVAAPQVVSAGGQAAITATVTDEGGSHVPDGVEVFFATSLGAVTPVTATTQGGSAGTSLTVGVLSGTAAVQASIGGLTATLPVTIVNPGEPITLTLAADPAQLRVDGGPGRLTASVMDGLGRPVTDGTVVQFAADGGTLSSFQAETAGGEASVLLSPGIMPGDVQVIAQAGVARAGLLVPVTAGQPSTVTLSADPGELVAGYNSVSHLRAEVQDRYGNLVSDGTPVTFTVSLGRVADSLMNTTAGVAATDFLGELVAGTSVITATAGGGAHGFVRVAVRPGPPAQMTLSVNPARIRPGGQVELAASVHDPYGNPVADGTVVDFRSSGGQLTAAAVPVAGGVALTRLETPDVPGKLDLIAQCGPVSANASVDVLWLGYLPLVWQ